MLIQQQKQTAPQVLSLQTPLALQALSPASRASFLQPSPTYLQAFLLYLQILPVIVQAELGDTADVWPFKTELQAYRYEIGDMAENQVKEFLQAFLLYLQILPVHPHVEAS